MNKLKEWKRILNFCFGFIFFAIGFIGIFVPGLPTTIFMIIAAYFFYNSSKKFYNYIINHPVFGENVHNYILGKGITKKAKIVSISSIWIFTIIGLQFIPKSIIIFPIILSLIGTLFIINQKTYKI